MPNLPRIRSIGARPCARTAPEDDLVLGRFLQIGLGRNEHEVRLARTHDQAYSIAPSFRPDVLVADWLLGNDVDGIEVAQVMRAGLPHLGVILMTGHPCEAVETKAAAAEISPVLAKPIELAELARAIARAAPNANGASAG